jgi:hypothetical protein
MDMRIHIFDKLRADLVTSPHERAKFLVQQLESR